MIAKSQTVKSIDDLSRYLHGPGQDNEHHYDDQVNGMVIGGNVAMEGETTGDGWRQILQSVVPGRKGITSPYWHLSLASAPGDRLLSDDEWCEAVQIAAESMGWENNPFVIVRHGLSKNGNDHVHVVMSRIGWPEVIGQPSPIWSPWNDRYRAMEAAREIEKRFGLTPVATPEPGQTRDAAPGVSRLTAGEVRRQERTGRTAPRTILAQKVHKASQTAKGQGAEKFQEALTAAGVQWKANIAKTGKMNGYSVALAGHADNDGDLVWFPLSKVDRALSWSKLSTVIQTPAGM